MHAVIGAFDKKTQAQQAVELLVQRGFARGDVHIEQREEGSSGASAGSGLVPQAMTDDSPIGVLGHFFARLFGTGLNETPRGEAGDFHDAVPRGGSVVVVDARDDQQAERAVHCLHEAGAIDVDDRAQQWGANGQDGVLSVVQEELHVGKRTLDRGGVRVVQRVSEHPVREVVRLREERAVVQRRPVDRLAEPGELSAFREGTLEVREMAEEAVVAKSAHVVEEVRVRKLVSEREQVIEDRLRRKDVDVQRIGAERATASETREQLPRKRDPDARSDKLRKDGPLA